MENIFFSIVIPTYNSQKTIIKCIESCINQSFQGIEIIIVDDYSNDNTIKVIEKYIEKNKIKNIRIKRLETNGGASVARNIGIKMAQGEYIAFLDSDDIWHPQKLEIVEKIITKHNINFLGHTYTLKNNFNTNFKSKQPVKISFTRLLLKNFAVTPSIVIRKDICEYFNENMTHTEDHELWLRIALKTKIYFLDLPLVLLGREELSEGGLSSNKWAMRKGELQMYKTIVSHKKSLLPFYPFLVIFSLVKHLKHIIKDFFAKD